MRAVSWRGGRRGECNPACYVNLNQQEQSALFCTVAELPGEPAACFLHSPFPSNRAQFSLLPNHRQLHLHLRCLLPSVTSVNRVYSPLLPIESGVLIV
jgi:hypothetical protein